MTDPTTMTPPQIDTALANLYHRASEAERAQALAAADAHEVLGERPRYLSRGRREWPTADPEAVALANRLADPDETYSQATGYRAHRAVTRYDKATAQLCTIALEISRLDAEFTRRGGWTRFFLVQNSGGHVHSSMGCQTCNRGAVPTAFNWLPEWSGRSEDEALAELGAAGSTMCTVCFPAAPVLPKPADPTRCTGGAFVAGTERRVGMNRYGQCPTCGSREIITASGQVRKHKAK